MRSAAPLPNITSRAMRLLACGVLATGALTIAAAAGAAAEPGGYGPVAPAPTRELGLVESVLATRTIGPAGDVLAATDGNLSVQVEAPAGMVDTAAQVTLHRVSGAAVAGSLGTDEELVAGWSVSVTSPEGTALPFPSSPTAQGVRLLATGPDLSLSDHAARYLGSVATEIPSVGLRPGALEVVLTSSQPGVLVVRPQTDAAAPAVRVSNIETESAEPSPADPNTAVDPNTGFLMLAGAAVLVAGGVLVARRRQHQ
jgi:LPXTG-motif cell wall-anchored protein